VRQSSRAAFVQSVAEATKAGQLVRLGSVTAINAGDNPPTISVDGRPMRCIAHPYRYVVGETVVWLDSGPTPVVLGGMYPDENARIGGKWRRATTLGIASASLTTVQFTIEDQDNGSFTTVPTLALTVPANLGGLYAVYGSVNMAASIGAGRAFVEITSSTSPSQFARNPFGPGEDSASTEGLFDLAAGDTFGMNVFQSSGGTINLTSARLHAFRLGA